MSNVETNLNASLKAYEALQEFGDTREMEKFFKFMDKFERATKKFDNLSPASKKQIFLDIKSDPVKFKEFMKFDGPYGNNRRRKMVEESMNTLNTLQKSSSAVETVNSELIAYFNKEQGLNHNDKADEKSKQTAKDNPYLRNLHQIQHENPLQTAYQDAIEKGARNNIASRNNTRQM